MAKSHGTKTTDVGPNRTGVQASPVDSPKMAQNTTAVAADPAGGAQALAQARAELSQQAPPVGTMPPPATVKGLAKTVLKALQGEKATVFLDKLGERLAFERTGVRLYDAVIAKIPASATREGTFDPEEVRRFRDQELQHFLIVKDAIEQLGGDPTTMTPCADVAGTSSSGLLKVVTDPRTTLTECLDTVRIAELADNDGWHTLIAMARALGQDDLASRFQTALAQEDHHLESVRRWLDERLGVQLGAELASSWAAAPAPAPPAS